MIAKALFLRPVLRRPARFFATVLGVAAGVAAVVATLASSRAAVDSLQNAVLDLSGATALEITRAGGLDESEMSRLAPLAEDAWIAPVVETLALCPKLKDGVRVLGIDPLVDARLRDLGPALSERFGGPTGALVFSSLLRGDGAFVPEPLAKVLGLDVGASLELVVAGKPVSLQVLAIVPAPPGTTAFDRTIVVDVALAEELAATPGRIDRIELVPRAGVTTQELLERASALVSPGVAVAAPRNRAVERAGLVRSLDFNLTALSGISLIVGAVLVATTLATSVVQRRPTIALLTSLGASRGQIVRSILLEALALGLLGGVLGVGLGYGGAQLLASSMHATVSTIVWTAPVTRIHLSFDHALIGIVLGVVSALVAAVLPVVEGARTPPIQALKGEAPAFLGARERRIALAVTIVLMFTAVELTRWPAWNGLPVAALLSAFALLAALLPVFAPAIDALGRAVGLLRKAPVPLRLACAALSAGRRRAAWGAGAVAVAVALSIAIASLVTSFRDSVIDWTAQSLRSDIVVRPLAGGSGLPVGLLDPAILDVVGETLTAADLDPTTRVDPYLAARAQFAGQSVTIAGSALRVLYERGGTALLDGEDPTPALKQALEQHEALVNEAGAQRFGWKVGDQIELDARGYKIVRRVAGIVRDYADSAGIVIVDVEDFRAWFPDERPRTIGIHGIPPDRIAAVQASIEDALSPAFHVDVLDNARMRAHVLSVFDQTFAITRALQSVAAIVAVIAVLSVLYALVSERRADLALLSAVGAGARQIAGVVCLQAGLLGLLGALGGVLCGLVIGVVVVKVVNLQSFGWTLAFVQPWSTMISTLFVVAIACTVSGLLPARAALSARPGMALREE